MLRMSRCASDVALHISCLASQFPTRQWQFVQESTISIEQNVQALFFLTFCVITNYMSYAYGNFSS